VAVCRGWRFVGWSTYDFRANLHKFIAWDGILRQRAKKRPKLMPEDYEANIQKLNEGDLISKAVVNIVIAKYNATYKGDGVLVMGICAGSVNTHLSTLVSRSPVGKLQN
jgi:hypothetical protein